MGIRCRGPLNLTPASPKFTFEPKIQVFIVGTFRGPDSPTVSLANRQDPLWEKTLTNGELWPPHSRRLFGLAAGESALTRIPAETGIVPACTCVLLGHAAQFPRAAGEFELISRCSVMQGKLSNPHLAVTSLP